MLGESCKGLSDKLKDKKNTKFIYILSPIAFLVLHMLCSIHGMLNQSISFANSIVYKATFFSLFKFLYFFFSQVISRLSLLLGKFYNKSMFFFFPLFDRMALNVIFLILTYSFFCAFKVVINVSRPAILLKANSTQVFSREICKSFENTYFEKRLQKTASRC